MSRVMKGLFPLLLCSLIVSVPSLWASWIDDGVPLCTATGDQERPRIASDGAGGAIVTWQDHRSGSDDIYAQCINATGTVEWTANGVPLCTDTGTQRYPEITSDGAGGAIVTWHDYRSDNYDIYAQRINDSGTAEWTADGVPLCTDTEHQYDPQLASDGAGGAIVTWYDFRSGSNYDIYAQRINASGTVEWTVDGVPLCAATGNQEYPQVASDGAGGAIVTWRDYRSGSNYDIYAQRINASGTVEWTVDGIPICTATGNQYENQVTSDGAGGAIVTWTDIRSGASDIYTQRMNASGKAVWTADGVPLCTATGAQEHPQVASDGAGGAIVTWHDSRNGAYDIYAQRINSSGTAEWTADGVSLCTATGNQYDPQVTSDGAGGAIVTWRDSRNGAYDIYAQRINASGTAEWTADGVPLCTATGYQYDPQVTSDGAGGAIVTWYDARNGINYDIYAQQIDSMGRVAYLPPTIDSISDVPGDQGGWARIYFYRSLLDFTTETELPVMQYGIYRRIDDPVLLSRIAAEGKLIEGGNNVACAMGNDAKHSIMSTTRDGMPVPTGREYLSRFGTLEMNGKFFVTCVSSAWAPPGTWEVVGVVPAHQEEEYICLVPTLADSSEKLKQTVYCVSAETTTPSVYYFSPPDSGYSVDNLPPESPEGLVAEQSFVPEGLSLGWEVNVENDLSHYAVYRGLSEDFVPAPGNRIATPIDPEYFDDEWRWDTGYYYKVSAVDIHGNESGFALLVTEDVTGTDTSEAPEAEYLRQNFPNPFNPATTIKFGLEKPSHISLNVYDAAGRLVRVIADDVRPAGHYSEVWDGKDGNGRAVSTGVYFYRLDTGSITQTRKMILLR